MKITMKKTAYLSLYILLALLTGNHIILFGDVLLLDKKFSLWNTFDSFSTLSGLDIIKFIGIRIAGILIGLLLSFLLYKLTGKVFWSQKNKMLLLGSSDFILLALLFSPLFFPFDGSYLSTLSEDEKVRYLVIFLLVMIIINFLFYFYVMKNNKDKAAAIQITIQKMKEENNNLRLLVDKTETNLQKTSEEIEKYADELNQIENLPPEIKEYYDSLRKCFSTVRRNSNEM